MTKEAIRFFWLEYSFNIVADMESNHESWMSRTLQLAWKGLGKVASNPLVGAVLVHPEQGLVAEGWHRAFGGPHAEVHCLNQVENDVHADWWKACTLYVNLEPCSHFGKTPPCANLIIEKQIGRVVVATRDPNPLVAGTGIQKLREAGIEVVAGILESEARHLNRHFFVSHEKGRPFVTLKWAETADGFLARADGSSKWISSDFSRSWVHQLRANHQAIWVGRNTLRVDNPKLNVRDWPGISPIRLVVDPYGGLREDLQVLVDETPQTWVFGNQKSYRNTAIKQFPLMHPEDDLAGFLEQLHQLGIQSLFVEGGSWLINRLLETGLWDEALVFQSDIMFDSGTRAPVLSSGFLHHQFRMGEDWVSIWEQ